MLSHPSVVLNQDHPPINDFVKIIELAALRTLSNLTWYSCCRKELRVVL